MHALVYTDTQTLVYREEKNPTEKPGESILKIQGFWYLLVLTCTLITDMMKEEYLL
jgi:hypothetical protein